MHVSLRDCEDRQVRSDLRIRASGDEGDDAAKRLARFGWQSRRAVFHLQKLLTPIVINYQHFSSLPVQPHTSRHSYTKSTPRHQ
jgi:hypothetical protein